MEMKDIPILFEHVIDRVEKLHRHIIRIRDIH